MAINYNGDVTVVLETQHRTPGNLRAFVQATLRSIKTGKSSDVRFSSTERLDIIPMMTRKMEFSYKDGEDYVFSDPETYETVTLSPEIVGDAKNYLLEEQIATVAIHESTPLYIELPASVELQVTYTEPGLQGDRSTGGTKPATVETGLQVQVPLFLTTGEKVRIDTRTGEYLGRV